MKKEKHYILITYERYTYSPNPKTIEPDVDSLQVIGFAKRKKANAIYFDAGNGWCRILHVDPKNCSLEEILKKLKNKHTVNFLINQ